MAGRKPESASHDPDVAFSAPGQVENLIRLGIGHAVGRSLKGLQKRAMDVTKGLMHHQPAELLADLAGHKAAARLWHRTDARFYVGRDQDLRPMADEDRRRFGQTRDSCLM